jgi:hypothetical protein
MPQVDGATIRDRAARLRAARRRARRRPSRRPARPQVRLLMERPDLGRTEGFAPARLATPAPPGAIVAARVTGDSVQTPPTSRGSGPPPRRGGLCMIPLVEEPSRA